jgi:hypothetical protein
MLLSKVKVLFPYIDMETLGETDSLSKIKDGKLNPYDF